MEFSHLRIFEAVSRHLNTTNAANELGISQPSVSLRLKQLENECGAQFYVRNNHGVELTSEGQAFLKALRPILLLADDVEAKFKSRGRKQRARPFVVGGSNTLSATVLPDLLVDFKRRNPNVNLLVETSTSRRIEEAVRSGEIEVALVTLPSGLPGCVCEFYTEHEAAAFVAADSPMGRERMSLNELTSMPLVVRKGSSTVSELQRRGYQLDFAAEFGAIESVKTAVRGGMGVGLLFRTRLEEDLESGIFRVLDVPELKSITLKMYIIFSNRQALSRNAKKFLDILREPGPGKEGAARSEGNAVSIQKMRSLKS